MAEAKITLFAVLFLNPIIKKYIPDNKTKGRVKDGRIKPANTIFPNSKLPTTSCGNK